MQEAATLNGRNGGIPLDKYSPRIDLSYVEYNEGKKSELNNVKAQKSPAGNLRGFLKI